MATFTYEGKTANGEVRKGKITAADEKAARAQLKQMNISSPTIKSNSGSLFKGKVTTKVILILLLLLIGQLKNFTITITTE